MTAKNFISKTLPVLKPSDIVDDALMLFNDYKVNYLPLINEDRFLGVFSEDLLLNYDTDFSLSEVQPIAVEKTVLENDSLLEAVNKAYTLEFDVIPVINSDGEYVGIIDKLELFQAFIGSLALHEPGGLLEINLKRTDYSLSEISRIIENESGKVISSFISTDKNNDLVLSLKLDISHISAVISALNRYGYEVLSYHSSEPINNLEKDRFDLLMKYLSI